MRGFYGWSRCCQLSTERKVSKSEGLALSFRLEQGNLEGTGYPKAEKEVALKWKREECNSQSALLAGGRIYCRVSHTSEILGSVKVTGTGIQSVRWKIPPRPCCVEPSTVQLSTIRVTHPCLVGSCTSTGQGKIFDTLRHLFSLNMSQFQRPLQDAESDL